jgi:hypothetical protein
MSVWDSEYCLIFNLHRFTCYKRFFLIALPKKNKEILSGAWKCKILTNEFRIFSKMENSKTLFNEEHIQPEWWYHEILNVLSFFLLLCLLSDWHMYLRTDTFLFFVLSLKSVARSCLNYNIVILSAEHPRKDNMVLIHKWLSLRIHLRMVFIIKRKKKKKFIFNK